MNRFDTAIVIRHARIRVTRMNWQLLALLGCAVALFARSSFAQVTTTITVAKVQDYKQTVPSATASPVPVTNPFTLTASAQAQGYTISSATVTPPGGSAIGLTSSSSTLFIFTSSTFATAAALNAAFPAGNYPFVIQGSTGQINGTVTMPTSDNYPPAPAISNTSWTAGALQFDPSTRLTLSWQAGAAPTEISLDITDVTGKSVYSTTVANTATSVTIPAATLQGGSLYTGRLTFGRTNTTAGSVVPRASYQSVTNFTLNPVSGSPGLITPTSFRLVVGQPIAYQLIANTNANYAIDPNNPLPAGLTFDPTTGIIFGTPTAAGSPSPGYTISNVSGTNGGILNLNSQATSAGATLANVTSATGRVGVQFTFSIATTGASTSRVFSATGLPTGLTLNASTGVISGIVNTAGSSAALVTVQDGAVTRTSTLQLTFVADAAVPVITSATRIRIYPGQTISYQVTANYGTNRADEPSFKVMGTLPTGLSFDPKTGIISGTFGGTLQRDGDGSDERFLNDSPLVQLAGTNTHGTGTSPLLFLSAPSGTVNLSTRLQVGTGDDVLIGGFIITGNAPESLILRAIGPSLKVNGAPLSGALQDTVLELHDKNSAIVAINDDWKLATANPSGTPFPSQQNEIIATGVPPSDDRESAIVATFQPSNFTALVSGKNGATGIGLVEFYDLGTVTNDTAAHAKLAQISTRGTLHTAGDVMIGGFIVQGVQTKTLLRAIGPSLSNSGVANPLSDPTLELVDGSGTRISFNDNWKDTQQSAIQATGVAPTDDRESAIVSPPLNPGPYTAILRGSNGATGVALVEAYALQ